MMRIYKNPSQQDIAAFIRRPTMDYSRLESDVRRIIAEVREGGDDALRKLTSEFDRVSLNRLEVTEQEIEKATNQLDNDLIEAIEIASKNIGSFHSAQQIKEQIIETMPGVRCWRRSVPIEKVGLYIPGGSAPLISTVLMLAIPASIAGCREIIICTPPSPDGSIHPAILFAAKASGVHRIFKVGGAQAIAAMALGTETIPAVFKIFGPGNQYVNAAKLLVQSQGVAIDLPAGPSEVCVLADDSCVPAYVAADLLSQAEHGCDSQVLLICTQGSIIEMVEEELKKQISVLPRKEIAAKALSNSIAVEVSDVDAAIGLANAYAPEHLIIAHTQLNSIVERVTNAGAVFLGNYSPESAGDYASGTNHTLPTNGAARVYSGVSIDSFVKKITYQEISREGLQNIGKAVEDLAEAEGLLAHKNAVSIRLK